MPAPRRDVRREDRRRADVPRGLAGRHLRRARGGGRSPGGVVMNDDKQPVNPHTGQPLPEDATPPAPPTGTAGAAAASAQANAAAKQSGPPQFSSMPSAQ